MSMAEGGFTSVFMHYFIFKGAVIIFKQSDIQHYISSL